nr:type II secretion system protein [Oscillospiraceae bacterium]
MKKQNRKGFTIVELVIVIAVIGILAAVLIPTFSGIIESANRTVDTQLVAQINTVLAVEDVLSGGVNEVVDIQNAIKKHGLKLETKSKGAYLWYDRDSGKVVLGSLDDNNNLEIIFGDDSQQSNSLKGKFDINMIALEGFIHGYYFISEESSDKFAEKICAVRNSDSETELRDALTEVTDVNASVGQQFRVFMSTHPLITNSGVIFLGDNPANASTAIVGGNVTEITADVIADLKNDGYTNIDHIDLHPGVTKVDESIKDLDIDFFHSSSEVDAFCKENNITNVHLKGERDKYIQSMNLVYRDTAGNLLKKTVNETSVDWSGNNPELNKIKWKVSLTPWLDSQVNGTANAAYDFAGYSFDSTGSASISLGTSNYFLTEADKTKVNENTGAITIYAVYDVDTTPDFKIGDKFYGSRAVTYMLYTEVVPGNNITVCSTDAVLDASLIGLAKAELTIPSGVALWVPCTTTTVSNRSGGVYHPYYNDSARATYGDFDKDDDTGVYQLEIAENVTIINNGYITVDAQLYQQGDSAHFGFISKNTGVLVVNGKITNNSRMEAYGVIRTSASGEVITKSGSTMVETMSILDLHGGQNTLASISAKNKISPFNSFSLDSIRLPLTIEHGAIYTTYGLITAASQTKDMEFKVAGMTNTPDKAKEDNPLFNMLEDSSIVKSYKTGEGVKITIHGDVEDCKKKVPVELTGLGSIVDTIIKWVGQIDFSFENIPMPLPDFDVTIASDGNLTLSKATAYKVLPGSDIVVEEGGVLNLGCRVIVYDWFELANVSSDVSARKYVTRNEAGEVVSYAFTDSSASLLVKGTLVLQNGAKFAGTIIGDANDLNETDATKKSTIVIESNVTTDCSNAKIQEGAGGKLQLSITNPFPMTKYDTVIFDWIGKWQTAPETYSQITTNPGTYQYNGGSWSIVPSQATN